MTDHANLVFINTEGSAKVKRWKLAIQEYDFDILHIPGKENVIADAFSRLVPKPGKSDPVDKPTSSPPIDDNSYIVAACLSSLQTPAGSLDLVKGSEEPYDEEQRKILIKFHNEKTGHHGVERTYHKMRTKNHNWPSMRTHIRSFIQRCPACQKMSLIRTPIQVTRFVNSTLLPMEKLQIDSIGPLPPTEDGYCHIIVIVDTFTRFVELIPSKDVSAATAAEALLSHSGRYGMPMKITSDKGSQFMNHLIEEFMSLMGTTHEPTMAYSKEENAIVERMNKEVMRHLRHFIYAKDIISKWNKYIPLVQRIINSNVNVSIGVSPAQLLFGNAVDLDRGIS
jgi:hypothetical protein